MRTTRRRSQNERKQPNQALRGKNKIRPNTEELSEKPDKGKQNRGGGVIMENRRKQTKLRETDNKAINSLTNQG